MSPHHAKRRVAVTTACHDHVMACLPYAGGVHAAPKVCGRRDIPRSIIFVVLAWWHHVSGSICHGVNLKCWRFARQGRATAILRSRHAGSLRRCHPVRLATCGGARRDASDPAPYCASRSGAGRARKGRLKSAAPATWRSCRPARRSPRRRSRLRRTYDPRPFLT